jgi:hypothetical protein
MKPDAERPPYVIKSGEVYLADTEYSTVWTRQQCKAMRLDEAAALDCAEAWREGQGCRQDARVVRLVPLVRP